MARKARSKGDLARLPPEVVLCILDHLELASVLAFTLTRRYYYKTLFNKYSQRQNRKSKEDLCQLLEKDLPNRYFCHDCTQLHRWHNDWSHRSNCWKRSCQNAFPYGAAFHRGVRGGFETESIGFAEARRAMNLHFYGGPYSYPLEGLGLQKSSRRRTGMTVEFRRTARILDDELFFRTVQTISLPKGDADSLRDYIQWPLDSFRLCQHITLSDPWPGERELGLRIGRLLSDASETQSTYAAASCPRCLTDLYIQIQWGLQPGGHQPEGDMKGWKMEVSVYQQLGSCRSPFDWKWRCMNECSIFNAPRRRSHPAGIVRRRWEREFGALPTPFGDVFFEDVLYRYNYIPGHRHCPWESWDHEQ